MVTGLWYNHDSNFGSLSWFWMCKEHLCPLSPDVAIWRMMDIPDWDLASWSWFGYSHWSSMSFKSSFGAFEDAEGSWLRFVILIIIHKESLWSAKLVFKFHLPQPSFSSDICSAQLSKYDVSGPAGRVRDQLRLRIILRLINIPGKPPKNFRQTYQPELEINLY